MIRAALGAVLMSAAVAIPARADAPVAERPTVKPGSSWDYADKVASVPCKHWEYVGDEKGFRVGKCEGYKSYTSIENNNLVRILDKDGDKVVQFSPSAVAISFPLKVGKKWDGSYTGFTADDGAQWEGSTSCEVKAYEKVTVAAGTFDAYRIECSGWWNAGAAQGRAESTAWYAPKAAAIVKSVNPSAPKFNLELTGYSLK
jgi:hypothetical protein